MAETQASAALQGVTFEGSDLASLLQKEFKPKTDEAKSAVETAIQTLAQQALANTKLFARDRHLCAYCGQHFPYDALTREHIVPTSRGGRDSWRNCITACRNCNGRKGNRTLDELNWSLYYLPYVPSLHEDMILRGRRILVDQMDFLLASVPPHSRLHQALS